MAEAHAHKDPNYMAIFWWLGALTVIEIAVIYMPLAKLLIGILLVALAISKATLVAMYFMHLRFETRTLAYVALTPLILGGLLVFILLPDHRGTEHRTSESAKIQAPTH